MNVFITGGSRGIGRAIVLKLVQEGHHCAFTYANNREAAEETVREAEHRVPGCTVRSYRLDLKHHDRIEGVIEQAVADFGEFEGVINNAAVVRDNVMAYMTDEEWLEVLNVNLTAPFFVIRHFLMGFLAQKKGRIINISSLAQDGSSGQTNYAASKAGLVGMTKSLAREYGPKNITSNVVVVGYVPTGMTEQHLAEKLKDIWINYCPARRVGKSEEVASAVAYLLNDEAGFINGEVLRVTGGLTYIP